METNMDVLELLTAEELILYNLLSQQISNQALLNDGLQMLAILKIISGLYHPTPFFLFGPPRSGKSRVIVESIIQLRNAEPANRFLITTANDQLADELTLNLLSVVNSRKEIVRLRSQHVDKAGCWSDDDAHELRRVSKIIDTRKKGTKGVSKYKIVLCTTDLLKDLVLKESTLIKSFAHVIFDGIETNLQTLQFDKLVRNIIHSCNSNLNVGETNPHFIISCNPLFMQNGVVMELFMNAGFQPSTGDEETSTMTNRNKCVTLRQIFIEPNAEDEHIIIAEQNDDDVDIIFPIIDQLQNPDRALPILRQNDSLVNLNNTIFEALLDASNDTNDGSDTEHTEQTLSRNETTHEIESSQSTWVYKISHASSPRSDRNAVDQRGGGDHRANIFDLPDTFRSIHSMVNHEKLNNGFPTITRKPCDARSSISVLPEYRTSETILTLAQFNYRAHQRMTKECAVALDEIMKFNGFTGPHHYVRMMQYMIEIEDEFAQRDRYRHDKTDRKPLIHHIDPQHCTITINPYVEVVPAFVMPGDRVLLTFEDRTYSHGDRVWGVVREVNDRGVTLQIAFPVEKNAKYTVHFQLNRLNYRLEKYALQLVKEHRLQPLLFPKDKQVDASRIQELNVINPRMTFEMNQRHAVDAIVAGAYYPNPYLLVGYAGTGKTEVIVESILQLYLGSPTTRILVTAPSNAVVDEIVARLTTPPHPHMAPVMEPNDCLRLHASSLPVHQQNSNYRILNFDKPGDTINLTKILLESRVVLCTLAVSGRIAMTDLPKTYFSHLFIDECHAAGEAMTLVPIAAICSTYQSITARVILSGDPQQMGPVVKSKLAKRMKYGRSMISRLVESNVYSTFGSLSSKLRINYRSHHSIVSMASALFYEQRMLSGADHERTSQYSHLFGGSIPIRFYNVDGTPRKETGCDSWCNPCEVMKVVRFVQDLVQHYRVLSEDIGIITPYKRQGQQISKFLPQSWRHLIRVGSVEQFQGIERKIVIVSTVRTNNIGFVGDEARINVMMTRARSLLIFMGHARSLARCSEKWEYIINQCKEQNTYVHD